MKLTIDSWREIGMPPVQIIVDGKVVPNAIVADEENGVVETYRKTAQGEFAVVGDGIDTVMIQGQVEIQFQSELSRKQAQSMLDRLEQR